MGSEPREQRIQTVCLLILSIVAVSVALWWLRPVMIPFVLAIFFALGLTPLIDLQRRYLRAPRVIAVLGTMVIGIVLLVLVGSLISVSVGQLAENSEMYQSQFQQLVLKSRGLLERFGFDPAKLLESISNIPMKTVGRMLVGTTNEIRRILSQGLLVLIFLLFLLLGGGGHDEPRRGALGEVEARIKRYIVSKALLSAATGLLVGLVLWALGIDLAMVFGLFAFLLNFIPSLGSVIATLLPLPVVLMDPSVSTTTAVLAIALPGLVQFAIGNVLEPKLMGGSLDLHPITIVLALIVWGMLWGVVGMLLAVPLTAVMKLLFERIEVTAPVAELLAGRLDALQSE